MIEILILLETTQLIFSKLSSCIDIDLPDLDADIGVASCQ